MMIDDKLGVGHLVVPVVPERLAWSVLGLRFCGFAEMVREGVEPSQDVVTEAAGFE